MTSRKIEKLTPEQEAELPKFRDLWFRYGISTERADRPTAEKAILALRAEINIKTTPTLLWGRSPLECLHIIHSISQPAYGAWLKANPDIDTTNLQDRIHEVLDTKINTEDLRKHLSQAFVGQHEAPWLALYLFCRDKLSVKYDPQRSRQLDLWADIARSSCWWWCYENYVIVSEKPVEVHMNEQERLHCETGPSVRFSDGYEIFNFRGVSVPRWIIMEPEKITAEAILKETNATLRWAMAERVGRGVLVGASTVLHKDKDEQGNSRTLYKFNMPPGEDAVVFVEVLCPTTSKTYHLRVDPSMDTCAKAVASTFIWEGKPMTPDQWQPIEHT